MSLKNKIYWVGGVVLCMFLCMCTTVGIKKAEERVYHLAVDNLSSDDLIVEFTEVLTDSDNNITGFELVCTYVLESGTKAGCDFVDGDYSFCISYVSTLTGETVGPDCRFFTISPELWDSVPDPTIKVYDE